MCNSTHCDLAPYLVPSMDRSVFNMVTSNKAGLRFHKSRGTFGNVISLEKPLGSINVRWNQRYQKIIGFGGAVTDAAALNINSLSVPTGVKLLKSYFGRGGLEYSMIRTPMGGTDFSTRPYSYAMTPNDTLLKDFTLQDEDYHDKIPIIHAARGMSKYNIKLITAPWSASPWMKTNNDWTNAGKLKKEYYQLWADYFAKYFKSYRAEGLTFWGLSPQNEPAINTYLQTDINGMQWTAEEQRDFVVNNLAPTLKREGLSYIKIFVGDDNRQSLPSWPRTVMSDPEAERVVAGTAVHFYLDRQVSPLNLDETKELFPDKEVIMTEACTGVLQEQRVILGSWQRGEEYAWDIIQNLRHWVSAWIDWNMALDETGGPTYIGNNVDSPIIVNATADEFYKQPMFYAMGHFSKYVPPGSTRIYSESKDLENVDHVAFMTPDRGVVVVILNKNDKAVEFLLEDSKKGPSRLTIPAKSINTLKYWQ